MTAYLAWLLLLVSTANSFTKLVIGESVYTTYLGFGEMELLWLYTAFFTLSLVKIAQILEGDR